MNVLLYRWFKGFKELNDNFSKSINQCQYEKRFQDFHDKMSISNSVACTKRT